MQLAKCREIMLKRQLRTVQTLRLLVDYLSEKKMEKKKSLEKQNSLILICFIQKSTPKGESGAHSKFLFI